MRILGFVDIRSNELIDPLRAARNGDSATVVALDPMMSTIARCQKQFQRGRQELSSQDIDAIVVYNGTGMIGIIAVLLSSYYSVPVVIRANGDIYRQHREKRIEYRQTQQWKLWARYYLHSVLTHITFRYARGFLAVSEDLARTLTQQTGCSRENVRVVHGPVNPAKYCPPNERSVQNSQTILTVTNLDYRGKYNGVRELVDTLSVLLSDREDLQYIIAGDGLYYDLLVRYVERTVPKGVARRIHTPGYVDDVAKLYANADVFAYVSYIDSYPNVILEAQAAGLPVVANPAYGMVEQIEHGTSGVLVNPSKKGALERTLSHLLEAPEERWRLGDNAAAIVERENNPTTIGRQMYAAIEEIVRNS
jgi:glycosyltransferase involved in cell wall biosynthesis